MKTNNKAVRLGCIALQWMGVACLAIGAFAFQEFKGKSTIEIDAGLVIFVVFVLVGLQALTVSALNWRDKE